MLEQWGCRSAAHVPWLLVLFLVVADRSEGRAATVLGGDHGCSYDCDPHFLGSRQWWERAGERGFGSQLQNEP